MKLSRSSVALLLSAFMMLSCLTSCTKDPVDTTSQETINTTSTETETPIVTSPIEDFDYRNVDGELTVYYKGKDSTVVFPSHIDGFPVTKIAENTLISENYKNDTIEKIVLPETVKEIGACAFVKCVALKEVVLPSSLEHIRYQAFFGCTSLKSIHIKSDCLDGTSYNAFAGCGIESAVLENVTTVPYECFAGCKLKSITLPSSVKNIENSAFSGCDLLETVILNDGLEKIYSNAFKSTAIKEIVIPGTVKELTENVFSECSSLEKITFNGDAPKDFFDLNTPDLIPSEVNYTVYYNSSAKGFSTPIWGVYPCAAIGTEPAITYENGFGYIEEKGDAVLVDHKGDRVNITVPDTLGGKPIARIGDGVFMGYTELKTVTLPDSVREIGTRAFSDCYDLEKISLPSAVEKIGSCAFAACHDLKTLTFPEGLEEIGRCAFLNCTAFEKIILPDSVKKIGEHAFSGNDNVTELRLSSNLETIEASAFMYTSSIGSVTIPSSVKEIKEDAFMHCGMSTLNLSEGLESIERYAFSSCKNLKNVTFPSTVTHLTPYAFASCTLESMKFKGDIPKTEKVSPSDVTLPASLFEYKTNDDGTLTVTGYNPIKDYVYTCIDIPSQIDGKTVTAIGASVLGEDTFCNFTRLNIPETVTRIEDGAFKGYKFNYVYIPSSVRYIGKEAFAETDISYIQLSPQVEFVGENAFNCGLDEIVIASSDIKITESSLGDLPTLKSIVFLEDAPENFFDLSYEEREFDYTVYRKENAKGFTEAEAMGLKSVIY